MIEVYADGADYDGIIEASKNINIKGFTTNPTLMRQAGVTDYEAFVRKLLPELKSRRPDTNISLEVFADDHDNIYKQAHIINNWGKEYDYPVYVKVPVTTTDGSDNSSLIEKLNSDGIKLNITAVFTMEQTALILNALTKPVPSIVSIFAGRIADTLVDPESVVRDCIKLKFDEKEQHVRFLWASCREVFNYVQADRTGCDIITMTPDQIAKLKLKGKNLKHYSRETVEMFYNDAVKSGFKI